MGSLDANITWSSDGIKQTVQDAIPFLGSLVSGVTTSPSDGTIELQGALGTVIVKPAVSNGALSLQVVSLTGLGFMLPRETVQPALDAFMTTLTKNLPMGIHADSVAVTDNGVTAKFVTRNATIPNGQDRIPASPASRPARRAPRASRTTRAGSRPRRASPARRSAVRIPPLALTPSRPPTVAAMISTATTDAPPAG